MYIKNAPLLPPAQERIVTSCLDCAFEVHKRLGPGFREHIYMRAYQLELNLRRILFEAEKELIVRYKEWTLPGQRVDLIVEQTVIVEIKSVKRLTELHAAQVISYLRAAELRVGLLLNFNETRLKNGLRRVVL